MLISNGIIGITQNNQARDRLCTTWAERSHVSLDTKHLFGLEDDDQAISTRKDALPEQMKNDEDAVCKLLQQFSRLDVFRINISDPISDEHNLPSTDVDLEDGCDDHVPKLMSLASNDVATNFLCQIEQDLLTAEDRGQKLVKNTVQQRLVDKTVPFFDPLTRNNSKTFGTLYKTTVTTLYAWQNKCSIIIIKFIITECHQNHKGRSKTYQTIIQCFYSWEKN